MGSFMNHQRLRPPSHRAYLVDFEEPILNLLAVLVDYCDNESMFSERDVLMMALNLLYVSYTVNEATEAMEIWVTSCCRFEHTPYNEERLRQAIYCYMRTMHAIFQQTHLYLDDMLAYTFAGWHAPCTPILVPNSCAKYYPSAIPAIVSSEPVDPHPQRIFRPIYERDGQDRHQGHHAFSEHAIPF